MEGVGGVGIKGADTAEDENRVHFMVNIAKDVGVHSIVNDTHVASLGTENPLGITYHDATGLPTKEGPVIYGFLNAPGKNATGWVDEASLVWAIWI